MASGTLICITYLLILFGLTKLFGIKYTDITKSTENIKKGLVYPIGIATGILTIFAFADGWAPGVFTFTPKVEVLWLWIIPILYVVSILIRMTHANWSHFGKRGIAYLLVATMLVGFSEELLVRGILVSSLDSSVIFGLLHFINYFNGQDLKTTSIQVFGTTIFAINYYVIFAISGTLWLPILLHFLYDFSLLSQGGEVNKKTGKESSLELGLIFATYICAIIALFFL
jgi:membrane protease YdiL (CAAX protease family)